MGGYFVFFGKVVCLESGALIKYDCHMLRRGECVFINVVGDLFDSVSISFIYEYVINLFLLATVATEPCSKVLSVTAYRYTVCFA